MSNSLYLFEANRSGGSSIKPVYCAAMIDGQNSTEEVIETDLLEPYERLVTIQIGDESFNVPEKNKLLRCFQYLSLKTISYGDFCWNGDCTNCQVWYHLPDQTQDSDKPALACRIEVIEGMVITKLSRFIQLDRTNK